MSRDGHPPLRVVFVFAEYSLHNHIIRDYVRARPADHVALVKVPLVLKGRGRRDTATRILPRLARRFVVAKVLEFLVLLALTVVPKILSRGAIFQRLRILALRHHLPFLKTDDVMSERALEFVRAQRPDVVVTLFHQIIKRPLIDIPRDGIVNIHPGLIPEFRGIQPYLWELSEGADRAGATLHLIEDEGIDTGRVLARTSYPIRSGMSVQLNYFLTCQAASRILPETLRALHDGRLTPTSQDPAAGAYFRWPDDAAIERLRERGHPMISARQLLGILSGRFDGPPEGSAE